MARQSVAVDGTAAAVCGGEQLVLYVVPAAALEAAMPKPAIEEEEEEEEAEAGEEEEAAEEAGGDGAFVMGDHGGDARRCYRVGRTGALPSAYAPSLRRQWRRDAWYAASGGEAAVRLQLRRWLPQPLQPSRVVTIDSLPLTAGGKLLRSALPPPPPATGGIPPCRPDLPSARRIPWGRGGGGGARDELRGPTERAVAIAWARVLPPPPAPSKASPEGSSAPALALTPRSHFFELGGNSILASMMLMHLRSLLDASTGGGTDAFERGNQRFATRLCGLYRRPRLRDYCVWLEWAALPAPQAAVTPVDATSPAGVGMTPCVDAPTANAVDIVAGDKGSALAAFTAGGIEVGGGVGGGRGGGGGGGGGGEEEEEEEEAMAMAMAMAWTVRQPTVRLRPLTASPAARAPRCSHHLTWRCLWRTSWPRRRRRRWRGAWPSEI